MSGIYRPFAYVLAANIEAVAMFFVAWYGGNWLNERYPQSFSWVGVTFALALLFVVRSWYLLFRNLLRTEKSLEKAAEKGANKP